MVNKILIMGFLWVYACLNGFCSDVFYFDSPGKAQGLHVRFSTEKAVVEDVKEADRSFYVKLFTDPVLMQQFGAGNPHKPDDVEKRVTTNIEERFKQGHPHGFLTIKDKNDPTILLGYMISGGGDRPGASEMAYTIDAPYHNQGIAKSVILHFVKEIAPEIKRIGESDDLIGKAFRCYGGQALNCLDATASPANIYSWKILDAAGFEAAQYKLNDTQPKFNFSGQGISLKEMEERITQNAELNRAVRYFLIDIYGKQRTFSIHKDYNRVKFHFEKHLK